MYRWMIAIAIYLCPKPQNSGCPPTVVTQKPTHIPTQTLTHISTLASTPSASPDIGSLVFRSGLELVLLVIMILALLCLIGWIAWKFGTHQWVSARSLEDNRVLRNAQSYSSSDQTYPTLQRQIRSINQSPFPKSQNRNFAERQPVISSVRSGEEVTLRREPPPPSQPEDPLQNKRWLDLVKGNVEIYEELHGLFPDSDPRQEIAAHVMSRLQEVLQHSGVEIISHDNRYNLRRHRLVPSNLTVAPGTPIAHTISPGFAVGRRVLRPAQVEVVFAPEESIANEKEREDE